MDRAPKAHRLLGWFCYVAGAAPFVAFVAEAFPSGLGHEDRHLLVANALIFAAGGVTAILVKNAAFNAFMALNALPYARFLFDHYGSDRTTWPSNDVEGSVVYVSLYCLLGMGSTAVWIMYKAPSLWRKLQKALLA